MDDLFYCIRIIQISTDKLQSIKPSESLRRSSLIRSTYNQSRKHFCDLIHSLIKISSTNNIYVPVIRENRMDIRPHKRKSSHIEVVKRIRLTTTTTSSSAISLSTTMTANVSNEMTAD